MKEIALTTPSLGARAEIRDDEVLLHAGNEGGRGVPSDLLLLPLRSDDLQDLHCALDWDEVRLGNGKPGPWNVYCSSLANRRPGPFIKTISPAAWAQAQAHGGPLLVVLSFGDPRRSEPDGTVRLTPQARTQLETILRDGDKVAWRRRGLLVPGPRRVTVSGAPPSQAKPETSHGKTPTAAEPTSLVFVLASCQYPAGIVDGTPQDFEALGTNAEMPRGPADASLLRLHDRLVAAGPAVRPSLLLLAGDQIYVDATAGLFDARAIVRPGASRLSGLEEDGLRVPYENWRGSVGMQSVFGRLSTRMMLDDHEICDNWEPVGDGPDSNANEKLNRLKFAGNSAYLRYQSVGRATTAKLWDDGFTHGAFRFFIANTRTGRDDRTATSEFRRPYPAGGRPAQGSPVRQAPHILDVDQHRALHRWLDQDSDQPGFILSPSIFLPRRLTSRRSTAGALHSDAWDGYPVSLEGLLAHIGRTRKTKLVFLSGDEHLSCVVRATVRACHADGSLGDPAVLHSIHSSALYAPYPFANAVPEEFASREQWCFDDPSDPSARYRCDVEVLRWVPGDGFACLHMHSTDAGAWRLDVEFDRAGRKPQVVHLKL